MDLMKELLTEQEDTAVQRNPVRYARFRKNVGIVQNNMEYFEAILKKGSQFSKLVAELGGDLAILKQANEAFGKLYDAMMDLEMSVGMAQDTAND